MHKSGFRMVSAQSFKINLGKLTVIAIYFSEFNHVKNSNDECVLVQGTTPLPDDDSCTNGDSFWYERTPYRLIPYSSCVDGYRPDHGTKHVCPGFGSKSGWFWLFMILIPFVFTALVGYYYYRRSGLARGWVNFLSFPILLRLKENHFSFVELFVYQEMAADRRMAATRVLLPRWLLFRGLLLGLLGSRTNGSRLAWIRTCWTHGGVTEMCL